MSNTATTAVLDAGRPKKAANTTEPNSTEPTK